MTAQSIKQAGAIVLSGDNRSSCRVLLILSKKKPQVRIFPKGHIEPGESAAAAAQRELFEEAGIRGIIKGEAGTADYEFREKRFTVTYFHFLLGEKVHEGESGRDPCWFTPEDACNVLPFGKLKELLRTTFDALFPA